MRPRRGEVVPYPMIFGRSSVSEEGKPADDGRWLIIGLGNPGEEYAGTRHNAGYLVIDRLASEAVVRVKRKECRSLIGRASFGPLMGVELAKPLTFMNSSGDAVVCLTRKEGRSLARSLVIVDDLAIPFGSIRLRRRGSSGGHNGLRSIIDRTGTEEFCRLRIGIRPEHEIRNARNFVLDRFPAKDGTVLDEVVQRSAEAVRTLVLEGVDKAMSLYNG